MNLFSSIAGAVGDIGASWLEHEWNSVEATKSRSWSKTMSNTAYQRAVEDLKKAGLNPILAAFSGGASTPSANQAAPVKLNNPVTSAAQVENTIADTDQKKEQAYQLKQQQALTREQTKSAGAQAVIDQIEAQRAANAWRMEIKSGVHPDTRALYDQLPDWAKGLGKYMHFGTAQNLENNRNFIEKMSDSLADYYAKYKMDWYKKRAARLEAENKKKKSKSGKGVNINQSFNYGNQDGRVRVD